jgi:4-amino-4-deoxy-L-arabinose transferase-like glycosyltransferase
MDVLNPQSATPADRPERWLIAAFVLAAFIRLLLLATYPVTDTTEARYAEIAREMVATGNWVTPQIDPGLPFWGKPPLSTWVTAASLATFGVNALAARLPHFLLCAIVCWLVFSFDRRNHDALQGWLSTTILATTPVFFISSGAVMTDATLLLGTTLAMVCFWRSVNAAQPSVLDRYGFFIGLAIGLMAKGPVALVLSLVPVAAWALLARRVGDTARRIPWVSGGLLAAALSLPWYGIAELRTPGFLDYFIIGEHWRRFLEPGWAGDLYGHAHASPRGTIWVYALIGTLPWCLLLPGAVAPGAMRRWQSQAITRDPLSLYLVLWLVSPLLFFTLARNILWTYVLPCAPAFALLAAQALRELARRRPIRVLAIAASVPVIVVVVLASVPAGRLTGISQKNLVARYFEIRPSADAKLLYLTNVPYSAQFYSKGASRAIGPDELNALPSLAGNLLALREAELALLPDALRRRLEAVARFGSYQLMRDPG